MWADIEGTPGYQVSTDGKVRSLDRVVVKSTGPVRYSGRARSHKCKGYEVYHV